jgi:hypothetical protein
LLLTALENEELRRRLAEMLDAEIGQLARLLEDRVIDPARPSDRTTPEQGMAICDGDEAVLTGFGLREPFMADAADLARQSCLALTTLARSAPGEPRRALIARSELPPVMAPAGTAPLRSRTAGRPGRA